MNPIFRLISLLIILNVLRGHLTDQLNIHSGLVDEDDDIELMTSSIIIADSSLSTTVEDELTRVTTIADNQMTTVEDITDTNQTLAMTAVYMYEELSIDGVDIPLSNSSSLYLVPLDNYTRLYTFVATIPSDSACVGMVASVDDDYMTTSSENCKCTNSPGDGYTQLGFNDSNWLDAVEYGTYGSFCSKPVYPQISSDANWIWVSNSSTSREVAFCRCYSDLCTKYNPCKNNGICNQNKPDICTCLDKWRGEFCELENMMPLAVTAKEHLLELYVDGIAVKPLSNADDWEKAMSLSVNAYSRLVAVSASNFDNDCEGILMSVDGLYAYTNGRWKCTAKNELDWFSNSFDDSEWPSADVRGNNSYGLNKCPGENPVDGISSTAEWIWTDDMPNRNTLIYCRGILPACSRYPCINGGKCNSRGALLCSCLPGYTGKYCEIVGTLDVTITAVYNLGGLYVDGVKKSLPNHSDYNTVDTLHIDPASKVIAIFAEATDSTVSYCHFILGSIIIQNYDYNYVTDANWVCTHNTDVGWNKVGFQDVWPAATIFGSNGDTPNCSTREFPEISSNALWIWTNTSNLVTFCRYNLPLCSYSPCQNGGTCIPNSDVLCTCADGFTGEFCEILSSDIINPALQDSMPLCGKNGFPVVKFSRYFCKCYPGFVGKNCEKKIARCGKRSCLNGGDCIDLASKFVCRCKGRFYGPICQYKI